MKEIVLTQGKVALVDDADVALVKQTTWAAAKHGTRWYAHGWIIINGQRRLVLMHRLIMGLDGPDVDHKDTDGLHNYRSNLRHCDRSSNFANRRKFEGYTSKYKGVSWSKWHKCWFAQIEWRGQKPYLQYWPTERQAALIYDAAARQYFGEFARLNFPEVTP